MTLSKEELDWAIRHWNTANYLSVASIYLKDNFFLEQPLKKEHIKDVLLGHWGSCPGINFIYTHLNLLSKKTKANILPVVGPGHGFAAILSNDLIDGSLTKYYPEYNNSRKGIGKTIKQFCWPYGFPSHANPSIPGIIHEGGELGYSLSTAFGAAFDNPNLIVACIIGDGEAETGPLAAAWHSNKYLNPKTDGAVLPILHLNGFKISSPSIYATMSNEELINLFKGYGYEPLFVGEDHEQMQNTLQIAYRKILAIKRQGNVKPIWPVIILKTRKGWTGIYEGTAKSHQVPLRDVKTNDSSFILLENWLKSYNPNLLFKDGKIPASTLKYLPKNRLGDNPIAIGIKKEISLPLIRKYELRVNRGNTTASNTCILGNYLRDIIKLNKNNFRIFSPDELSSNRLDAVLEATKRRYVWKDDEVFSKDGRVMEMLSEHTLQGWLQGYLLTGRHGIFPSYEAFLPIVDSMVSQHLKFLKASRDVKFRKPISAMNYLLTSVCWRQDHNGFSHQNPGFINVLLDKAKEEQLVRMYFPADANSLLATAEHCFESTDRINIIVSDKQNMKQWLSYDEAIKQAKTGAAIWNFASDSNPEVVLAACGDYQTQETLAAITLLKKIAPVIRIRMVNVSELNVLGEPKQYPNAIPEYKFDELFTIDKDVIFSFHGYPETVKQLLFDRNVGRRFFIMGYQESGSTTTPFDLLIRNKCSRYHIAIEALLSAAKRNKVIDNNIQSFVEHFEHLMKKHKEYILEHGKDPEEIDGWGW